MRILDFTHVLAGPYATMMLGDMGADVIKIERLPGGDETRQSVNMLTDDVSMQFAMVNRNKRSVALDLSHPDGLALVHRMVHEADAIIENWRPGAMAKLGIGPDDVRKINPRTVYCSISGFGQTGPLAQRGGFDLIAQGMSGIISVTGEPDGVMTKVGIPLADLVCGIYSAFGIVTALLGRERLGHGDYLDLSLLDSAVSLMVWEGAEYWGSGRIAKPQGMAHRNRAPYEAFQASDGWFLVGAGNESSWRAMCQALDRGDLMADPRFIANRDRVENVADLRPLLNEHFAGGTVEEWIGKLADAGCPCGPVLNMEQVLGNEQIRDRDMVIDFELDHRGRVNNIGSPLKFATSPPRVHRGVPRYGEHTAEVLRELCGVSDQVIVDLGDRGVVHARAAGESG